MTSEQIQIHSAGRAIDITLQRSRRRKRTLAVTVKVGQVFLKTPHRVGTAELQRFAQSKAKWIADKLRASELKQQKSVRAPGTVRLLGHEYSLQIEKSPLLRRGGFCELLENILYVHIQANLAPAKEKTAIRNIIKAWHQAAAREVFDARTKIYAAQIGVQVQCIRLADPKSRWGSCDRQGRLMFSWRAVMVPLELVDYLIVHELCHLVHFDHSKAYWQAVEKILPDYKIRRKALRAAESLAHLRH